MASALFKHLDCSSITDPYHLNNTVLYCIVLYCTVLHCTVLYCTVQYCTVLYCTVVEKVLEYTKHPDFCFLFSLEGKTPNKILYCTVLSLYLDERRGVQGNTIMNSQDQMFFFPVLPGSSQGTDIIHFIKVMKL